MQKTRYALSLALLAPLVLAAGCGTPKETAPTKPPVQEIKPPSTVPPVMNDHMGMGTTTGGSTTSTTTTPPMMKPVTPPALTETQKAELKAGEEAHKPKELTFHVNGGNFYYVPNVIKVKKGDKVKIIFQNDGGYHNFALDEFKIKIDPINTGASSTIEFVADKTGTFEYYCSVGQHRQMGQKGQLIVE